MTINPHLVAGGAWAASMVAAGAAVGFLVLQVVPTIPSGPSRPAWMNDCRWHAVVHGAEAADAERRCGDAWRMRG